jgi:type IV pilus assembly protein PilV
MNKKCPFPPRSYHHGFTMIEVLVALVILAVGILGVASLQGNALRFTHNAQLRSQAIAIAQDMVERLRTNRDHALLNNDNYRVALQNGTTQSNGARNCNQDECDAGQLAAFDRDQWLQAIGTLPSGRGEVRIDAANYDAEIWVMWDDRSGEAGAGCSGYPDVALACMNLKVRP